MKYVRTKDGIEKLDADREHLAEYMNVKQADTIEELCDEFVYVASKKDKPILVYKPSVFHKLSDELYGAIWTNKGLIYVAKMNNKGELELLCEKR